MPDDRTFFDTNVLVYAHDRSEPERHAVAHAHFKRAILNGTFTASLQVLQEFYVVAVRKIRTPLDPREAQRIVADLLTQRIVEPTGAHLLKAIDLSIECQVSFWDALILVAAIWEGCSILYTEDLQDGAVIEGVRIENPFRALSRPKPKVRS